MNDELTEQVLADEHEEGTDWIALATGAAVWFIAAVSALFLGLVVAIAVSTELNPTVPDGPAFRTGIQVGVLAMLGAVAVLELAESRISSLYGDPDEGDDP